jgi:nucleoside-diphosphate-sugar epimerase
MAKEMKKIMVTGSVGQIGSELTMALREKYGNDNVVATGHRTQPKPELRDSGPFEFINVTKRETIDEVVKKYDIDTIYHLSAILSAVGEKNPYLAWDVNMNGTYNILEAAREFDMTRIFVPSVRRHKGCWRTPVRLLRQTIRCGRAGLPLSGYHQL